ncbi:hypothetical protein GOP47_0008431 [Adiantum capillus-veneris]|uniref:Phytocyanin domain-containing protein n=1 Tax=Adiantum capillus-veneris TaxID=13818 RepID=A0A9D4UYE1_ADICA|nr:hypothetical protein GOP47_0008431 [Adiantum capillus-veneris]
MAAKMLLMVAVVLLLWAHESSAALYNVGDPTTWTLPSIDYNKWARTKHIRVNDVLKFTYSPEIHNVVLVSKSDYDNCSSRRPIARSGALRSGHENASLCSVSMVAMDAFCISNFNALYRDSKKIEEGGDYASMCENGLVLLFVQ